MESNQHDHDPVTRKWQQAMYKELVGAPWTMRITIGVFLGTSLAIVLWGGIGIGLVVALDLFSR